MSLRLTQIITEGHTFNFEKARHFGLGFHYVFSVQEEMEDNKVPEVLGVNRTVILQSSHVSYFRAGCGVGEKSGNDQSFLPHKLIVIDFPVYVISDNRCISTHIGHS